MPAIIALILELRDYMTYFDNCSMVVRGKRVQLGGPMLTGLHLCQHVVMDRTLIKNGILKSLNHMRHAQVNTCMKF